jgi:DNA-directed RNA polymerase specialized sigma subunit
MIENNKVYELLTKPRRIKAKLKRINSEIEALTLAFALPKGLTYDKDPVQTSPDDAMAKYMVEKDRLVRIREKLLLDYSEAQAAISRQLNGVNEVGALIISYRFLEERPFPEIAMMICRSERQMYRYYHIALDELAQNLV